MIEKQALALERRQDTKSLGYDIVQEALLVVDDLLLDDSLSPPEGIHKQVTNKILLDDSPEKMQLE